jgi:hypothetical protein
MAQPAVRLAVAPRAQVVAFRPVRLVRPVRLELRVLVVGLPVPLALAARAVLLPVPQVRVPVVVRVAVDLHWR